MTECSCGCHKRQLEAVIKGREAQKNGNFYYYHEDCYCCSASMVSGFGLDDKADK